jgi:hypothetical protein
MNKLRQVEKRDWRKNMDKCWNVQEQLNACITNSESFKSLDENAKSVVLGSTNKGFIWNYLNMWARPDYKSPEYYNDFFNTSSSFWNKNEQSLTALNSECNLFSLYECCKETYDLNNLKGNYEFYNRHLRTE